MVLREKNMKCIELEFQGYTWDEYFYAIANKPGILVVYRGGLDSEGTAKMKEIIYVDEADEINTIYESIEIGRIRKTIGITDRLFFSYAEMQSKGRTEVTKLLKSSLMHGSSNENELSTVRLTCKGACALFPHKILQEI